MTRDAAFELWGPEAVAVALAEPAPEPITRELVRELERRAELPPGAFRAWALAQPWPRFCTVVRIVAGVAREDLLDDGG